MKRLSFIQSTDIMKTCIKNMTATPIALQTATRLRTLLQQENTTSITRKNISTLQSTQSATNNNYIVFHTCPPFLFNQR